MSIDKINNYIELSSNFTIEQYQNSPLFKELLAIQSTGIQELEDAFFSLLEDVNVRNAYGYTLDRIGENIGEFRQGKSDDLYRLNIFTRIAINTGGCDPEFILSTVKKIVNPKSIRYSPLYPANYQLTIRKDNFDINAIPLIKSLSPAGVGEVIVVNTSEGEPFVFSEVYVGEYILTFNDGLDDFLLNVNGINDNIEVLTINDIVLLADPDGEGFGEIYLTPFLLIDTDGVAIELEDNVLWDVFPSNNNEFYTTSTYGGQLAEIF